MSLPSVTIEQLDGALGTIPIGTGDVPAVIAPADAGPLNTPAGFADPKYLVSNFTAGPLVELASYLLAKGARSVIAVRSGTTTAGTAGVIDVTGVTGTSVASLDAAAAANDEYDIYLVFVKGGTIGVEGITYKWARDGGRAISTLSPETALGTANSITIPDSGGVKINFAPGTIVAGNVIRARTTPPSESVSDLQTSFGVLQTTKLAWNFVVPANVVDPAKFAALDTWMQTLWTRGKHKKFLCSMRGPEVSESGVDYLAAMGAAWGSSSSLFGALCYAYARTQSAVSGQLYRRPVAWPVAAWAARLKNPRRDDMAAPALGPLPTDVQIVNAGNPDEWNEEATPGADDYRFLTLRTIEGYDGTYVTRPRVFAPAGSDFTWWQYRAVMNAIADAVRIELTRRLRAPVRVSKKTGFILEQDAVDIEKGVDAAVEAVVGAGPDVSGHKFTLSRTDPLLTTPLLNGAERVIPLAYPDQIGVTLGFVNPARVIAV